MEVVAAVVRAVAQEGAVSVENSGSEEEGIHQTWASAAARIFQAGHPRVRPKSEPRQSPKEKEGRGWKGQKTENLKYFVGFFFTSARNSSISVSSLSARA